MWAILAITASICWGVGYAYSEKILSAGISPAFLLLVALALEVVAYFGWILYEGSFKPSANILLNSNELIKSITITAIAFTIGNLAIFTAIGMKNATHASFIEITYPVFTLLFTFLLFKTVHLTPISALGGILILSGAALIIYKG